MSDTLSATRRAMKSAPPPALLARMSVTGSSGDHSAIAGPAKLASAKVAVGSTRLSFMIFPSCRLDLGAVGHLGGRLFRKCFQGAERSLTGVRLESENCTRKPPGSRASAFLRPVWD